jgi:hypothetical protein
MHDNDESGDLFEPCHDGAAPAREVLWGDSCYRAPRAIRTRAHAWIDNASDGSGWGEGDGYGDDDDPGAGSGKGYGYGEGDGWGAL